MKDYFELFRGFTLPLSVAPWFLALCFSICAKPSLADIILTFIVVLSLHIGVNLFDDCYDIARELKKCGNDMGKICFNIGKNKAQMVTSGKISYGMLKVLTCLFFLIPFLIGCYFTLLYGLFIPFFALLTIILCLLYPIATKKYMGEAIIAILFGPMLTFGSYFILTIKSPYEGTYYPLFFLSLSAGLVIAAVGLAHSIMDFDFDIEREKCTLATLFKSKQLAIYTLGVIYLLAYLNIVYLCAIGILQPFFLLLLFTLPIVVRLIKSLNDYVLMKDTKLERKWYYGIFENWKTIEASNNKYFLYRFYLARNAAVMFCTIAGLLALAFIHCEFYGF